MPDLLDSMESIAYLGIAACLLSIPIYTHQAYAACKKADQLADENNSGHLEFNEKADVYKRMGFKGPFRDSKGREHWPHYELSDLQKAIKSYEAEKAAQQRSLPEATEFQSDSL